MTEPIDEKTERNDEGPVRTVRNGLVIFICIASLAAAISDGPPFNAAASFGLFVFLFLIWLVISLGIFSSSISGSYVFRNIVLFVFTLCVIGGFVFWMTQGPELDQWAGMAYMVVTFFVAIFFIVPIASGMFAAWLCKMLQRSSASGRNENA
ncbi:MAG: hypothetical protein OEV59_01300 [Deltaproteobacteria bacterium]|nr:hypothetical protein [Deltaproteobacteria bacterium]